MASRTINRRPIAPDDPRHGIYAGYLAGCREDCCRKAELTYQAERRRMVAYGRPRKVESALTLKQLRSLMAAGWSGEYLAGRLGVRRPNLLPRHKTIRVGYADKVQVIYNELRVLAGPSSKTRLRALNSGWTPPVGVRSRADAVALIRRNRELGAPDEAARRYLQVTREMFAGLLEEVEHV